MRKLLPWLRYGGEKYIREKNRGLHERWFRGEYSYCKRTQLLPETAALEWLCKLQKGESFVAAKLGQFELSAMRNFEFRRVKNYALCMENLSSCAGFFPKDVSYGERFLTEMTQGFAKLDYLMAFGEAFENYFIDKCSSKNMLVALPDLTHPWRMQTLWTHGLAGKRVLVVHPFASTIESQYQKRERLFPGKELLPEFTLLTYRPVMSIGEYRDERFASWFDALEFMFGEIAGLSFDAALLGCGAYGFPLAVRIHERLGKTAIHIGGTLQLFFGIMGRRWDGSRFGRGVDEEFLPYYSTDWVYPSAEETPAEAGKVEYGPYWK